MKPLRLFSFIFFLALSSATMAQPGGLDVSFGGDGIVTTTLGGSDERGRAVVVQPDGKIIVAGYADGSPAQNFLVLRYNTDGTLDSGFGTAGVVTTAIGAGMSVALQADGKIVVAGYSSGSDMDFVVARYTTNGTLDNSFGTGGSVSSTIGSHDVAMEMALQADGKVVVAGYAEVADLDFAVMRYTSAGVLDNSFSGDGKLTTSMGALDDQANAMALQADGKIIAAGNADAGMALVRYNADGTLDNSFSGDGKVVTVVGGIQSAALAVAVAPDGKVLAAGNAWTGSSADIAVARYNADGTLDNSFSTDGQVTTAVGTAADFAEAIAVQADGKIVVGGYAFIAGGTKFTLVRYNADGTLDSSFGTAGISTTTIGMYNDGLYGMALAPDGKIVTTGFTGNGIDNNVLVTRYLSGLNIGILDLDEQHVQAFIHPNPVHASALLEYELLHAGAVSIQLLDMQGKTVHRFMDRLPRTAGKQAEQLAFPASITPGTYMLDIATDAGHVTVRMVKR